MNKKQRYVLYACAAVIVLMLLFPPFHTVFPRGQSFSRGYGFLLSGPAANADFVGNSGTVDVGTLLVQWLGVILAGAILWFAFRDKKEEVQNPLLIDPDAGEKRQNHPE